jgi:hypothetical protein
MRLGLVTSFEKKVNCYNCMPVLSKLHGIVIRTLIDQTFGVHLHAFHGDSEMVVAVDTMRVIQSDVPDWVEAWVLDWARRHAEELILLSHRDRRTMLENSSLAGGETESPFGVALAAKTMPTALD